MRCHSSGCLHSAAMLNPCKLVFTCVSNYSTLKPPEVPGCGKTQSADRFERARLQAEPLSPLKLSFRRVRSRACAVHCATKSELSFLRRCRNLPHPTGEALW